MPNATPLADLRDIHLPHAISAWPPGPAYYALMALLIILILLFIQRQKHQQRTAPKREALVELARIENNYTNKKNHSNHIASDITRLLRRVALVYHPRIDVASLHGQAWVLFLEKTSRGIDFQSIENSLLDTPFNPHDNPHAAEQLSLLLSATRRWIKQRRKQCLN
jgi:hypothetical protein